MWWHYARLSILAWRIDGMRIGRTTACFLEIVASVSVIPSFERVEWK